MNVKDSENLFSNGKSDNVLHSGHMIFDTYDLYSVLYIAIIFTCAISAILFLCRIFCCDPFSVVKYAPKHLLNNKLKRKET